MEMPAMSSRILYDVPCVVCRDHSSGKHYGVYACDGCAGFFKRSVRRQRSYACKARSPGRCLVDKTHRNQCRACRLDKCIDAGMNRDAVQHERGPRNSTIRRQMSLFMDRPTSNDVPFSVRPVTELMIPKRPLLPPPPPMSLYNPFLFNRLSILSPPVVPFLTGLPSPPVTSRPLVNSNPGVLCESAAKLLFMNVKWSKGVTEFEALSISDRTYLLGESWKDLFVLGAAQFLYPMDLNNLLSRNNATIDTRDVELFQAVLTEIAKLNPDGMEYTCLRAIVLFKLPQRREGDLRNENTVRLEEVSKVAAEQDRRRSILNEYVALKHPVESSRLSQLLRLVSIMRQVSSDTIVDLFFRPTIGDIAIERIICDMYKTA